MDILNISTVCEKRELEWATVSFNFRPIGIAKALMNMSEEYAKASLKSPDSIKRMFNGIANKYDLLNRLLTAGLDQRWRQLAAQLTKTDKSSTVLDACTGTGDLAFCYRAIDRREGCRCRFQRGMLELARKKALDAGRTAT